MKHWLLSFFKDLRNKGAHPNIDADKPAKEHFWIAPVSIIGAIVSLLNDTLEILITYLGVNVILLPPIFITIGIFAAYKLVTEKLTVENHVLAGYTKVHYRYSNTARTVSKLILLILLFCLLNSSIKVVNEYLPLQNKIYGFVVSTSTGEPYENVSLLIENADGNIISDKPAFSDSEGFYIIELAESFRRQYRIRAQPPVCKDYSYFTIHKWDETETDPYGAPISPEITPVFKHYLNCK